MPSIEEAIASSIGSVVGAGVSGVVYGTSTTKDGNILALIDLTSETSGKDYTFPFLCLIVGNAVFSAVMHYSYTTTANGGNNATYAAVNQSNTTELVSSWDLVVNGHIVTKRRYGNPGIAKNKAFSDAKAILNKIYNTINSSGGASGGNSYKVYSGY